MGRLMALDYGRARIGVAISDEVPLFARAMEPLSRDPHLLDGLKRYLAEYSVEALVLGLPLHVENMAMYHEIQDFAAHLQNHFSLPIFFQDETLSSEEAKQDLHALKVPRKKRKARLDSLAAKIILERFIRSREA